MRSILCVLVLLGACHQPPNNNGPADTPETVTPDPTEHVARIRYAPSEAAANTGQFTTDFTLLGQRDIYAVINVSTAGAEPTSGVHFMRFDVLNPEGAQMQTQSQAFSFEAGAPSQIMHPEFEFMVDVQKVTSDEGWVTLRASIPVAGSAFTRHRLLGEFTGAAYIGLDREMPSIASTFEMRQ